MFWNDPNLYGASFPFKDIAAQTQVPCFGITCNPWTPASRYIPQTPYLPFQQASYTPWVNPSPMNPFIRPEIFTPYAQTATFNRPEMFSPYGQTAAFNPYLHPYGVNLPIQSWYRPYMF